MAKKLNDNLMAVMGEFGSQPRVALLHEICRLRKIINERESEPPARDARPA
jgi:hypothetical protein